MRAFRPPTPESVTIAGPAGPLEALLEAPEPATGDATVVVCHPHPLHGGTMRNKVVHMLARTLQMRGMPTVRFNYRGVGASAGTYDDGRGETDDAVAVAAWSRDRWPHAGIVTAGFSFGAAVALRAAIRAEATRLVTVAPPVDRLLIDQEVPVPDCPWLVIHGSRDELIPLATVERWVGTRVPTPAFVIIDGADHFFHGKLIELRDALLDWMEASH